MFTRLPYIHLERPHFEAGFLLALHFRNQNPIYERQTCQVVSGHALQIQDGLRLSRLYWNGENYQKAIDELNRVIDLEPANKRALCR